VTLFPININQTFGQFQAKADDFKHDTITMTQMAIDLFIRMYLAQNKEETFRFLLDQFEFFSECDTSPSENEV